MNPKETPNLNHIVRKFNANPVLTDSNYGPKKIGCKAAATWLGSHCRRRCLEAGILIGLDPTLLNYVHTHTCMCTCSHTHTHIYIYISISIYIYIHIHIHIYTCMYVYVCMYIYIYIYALTYIRTYIHTYIHTLHTYIHTYIRTYIHTYIHHFSLSEAKNPSWTQPVHALIRAKGGETREKSLRSCEVGERGPPVPCLYIGGGVFHRCHTGTKHALNNQNRIDTPSPKVQDTPD